MAARGARPGGADREGAAWVTSAVPPLREVASARPLQPPPRVSLSPGRGKRRVLPGQPSWSVPRPAPSPSPRPPRRGALPAAPHAPGRHRGGRAARAAAGEELGAAEGPARGQPRHGAAQRRHRHGACLRPSAGLHVRGPPGPAQPARRGRPGRRQLPAYVRHRQGLQEQAPREGARAAPGDARLWGRAAGPAPGPSVCLGPRAPSSLSEGQAPSRWAKGHPPSARTGTSPLAGAWRVRPGPGPVAEARPEAAARLPTLRPPDRPLPPEAARDPAGGEGGASLGVRAGGRLQQPSERPQSPAAPRCSRGGAPGPGLGAATGPRDGQGGAGARGGARGAGGRAAAERAPLPLPAVRQAVPRRPRAAAAPQRPLPRAGRRPRAPLARRGGTHMPALQEDLLLHVHAEEARAYALGREALHVRAVRQELPVFAQPEPPRRGAHAREAARLPLVRAPLHAIGGPLPPRAQVPLWLGQVPAGVRAHGGAEGV